VNIEAGAAYLSPLPGLPNHLVIVVHGPFIPAGYSTEHVIIVNVTSVKGSGVGDQTCVLRDGEHRCIHHDSRVNYPLAECVPVARLKIDFESGRLVPKEPVRPEVLARVLEGMRVSKHTKRRIKAYLSFSENEATG
jgi:hypothetical protein